MYLFRNNFHVTKYVLRVVLAGSCSIVGRLVYEFCSFSGGAVSSLPDRDKGVFMRMRVLFGDFYGQVPKDECQLLGLCGSYNKLNRPTVLKIY